MRDFDSWCRYASRKADRTMWGGMGIVLLGVLYASLLARVIPGAGEAGAPVLYQLRWVAMVLFAVGGFLVMRGGWTHWRLFQNPVDLYHRRTGN